jgi:hypothetical protein
MRKLFVRFSLALPLTASAIAFAAPAKCSVAGEVEQWIADFCMYSVATDDLAHPDVVACINKQPEARAVAACKAKTKYKAKICAIVVQGRSYPGSVKQCLKNESFSGPTVRGSDS